MSATDVAVASPSQAVQRKCGDGPCGCGCTKEPEKRTAVHRQPAGAGRAPAAVAAPATAARIRASRGTGAPLPAAARGTLETAFGGRDFSAVRVHADHGADESARSMGANAFTVGNDVFFASGRYDPESAAGRRLLAHELTHVVQQSGAADAPATQLEVGATDTAAEREADRIADAVVASGSAGVVQEHGGAVIRRATDPAVTPTTDCKDPSCLTRSDDPAQVCRCPLGAGGEYVVLPASVPLRLEKRKASDSADYGEIQERYRNAAEAHALNTRYTGRAEPADLWGKWADKHGGASARTIVETQKPPGKTETYENLCSPDHVIELQFGGADDGNNLRMLAKLPNSAAGGAMASQVTTVLSRYFGEKRPSNKFVEFTAVTDRGDKYSDDDVCVAKEKEISAALKVAGGPKAAEGTATMAFTAGGNEVTIGYDAASAAVASASRYAVSSLELKTAKASPDELTAIVSEKIQRNPLLTSTSKKDPIHLKVANKILKIDPDKPSPLAVHFPFLSDATLHPVIDKQGWAARGTLIPTLPILRHTKMQLELRNDELRGKMNVDPAAIRKALPIPGLKIDPVTLEIGVVDGVFSATGDIGFAYGTFASGKLESSWSAGTGLLAKGTLDLKIPGIDEAKGVVSLENGRMNGLITISQDKVKFPGVQSAKLEIAIADGVLTGTGNVILAIPGLDAATLLFVVDTKGEYKFTGTARGTIPALKDPHLELVYSKGKLTGKGGAGFKIPGMDDAKIGLTYADGKIAGSAHIAYKKGKLAGNITAKLSPEHAISGRGEMTYEVAPGLTAAVVLLLRENGTFKVEGEIKLPDPIKIFPEKSFQKRLFGVSIDIPIFGISVGSTSVGIILNLSAQLDAKAGIGPGQLRKTKVFASFDPSDEHGATKFEASGELYVPAHAGIALVLRGGLGVSLLIVKAIGGLQATGEVGLVGALSLPIALRYAAGKLGIDGAAILSAQPHLHLALDAFVTVKADLLVTSIDVYTKTWKLAAFDLPGDFTIGLKFPVQHTFGEPFKLSLDQIEFIAPQVDARKLAGQMLPK
jgi:uncharacterized protein DUF4157